MRATSLTIMAGITVAQRQMGLPKGCEAVATSADFISQRSGTTIHFLRRIALIGALYLMVSLGKITAHLVVCLREAWADMS